MKIAFRTDVSNQIGTGHFMRCLSLADELKKQGAILCFISRNLPTYLIEALETKGMLYIPLGTDSKWESCEELGYSYLLTDSQIQDAQGTIEALADQSWDWVVVDHYSLDKRWENLVYSSCKKLMVIDDLADRQHDCDILLDQNFYSDMQRRYTGKVPERCRLLLGPKYALLREEFRIVREKVKVRTGNVKKILVFFGGVDEKNYTRIAIQALVELNTTLQVDVVIGYSHPNVEQIEQACVAYGFTCHVQTTRMAELMAEADLAIGAGGTATWERCCMGLPTVSFCIAENQQKLVMDAAARGFLYAPTSGRDLVKVIRDHVRTILENPALIKLISEISYSLVDGKGSSKVAGVIGSNFIEIQRATQDYSISIFGWRNHPKILEASISSDLIPWEQHQRWFEAILADKNRELLIGLKGNQPVGVVRFDILQDAAEVSIYLVPDKEFAGQGEYLLKSAEQWLSTNRPEIKRLNASVLVGNYASKKLFRTLNYYENKIFFQKNL